MRLTILIVACLITGSAFCQKDTIWASDTIWDGPTGLLWNRDSLTIKADSLNLSVPWKPSILTINAEDTIRCIMLLCDTSYMPWNKYYMLINQNNGRIEDSVGYAEHRTPIVYWQFGYEVRTSSFRVAYLDEMKRPLPPNIYCWMSQAMDSKNSIYYYY